MERPEKTKNNKRKKKEKQVSKNKQEEVIEIENEEDKMDSIEELNKNIGSGSDSDSDDDEESLEEDQDEEIKPKKKKTNKGHTKEGFANAVSQILSRDKEEVTEVKAFLAHLILQKQGPILSLSKAEKIVDAKLKKERKKSKSRELELRDRKLLKNKDRIVPEALSTTFEVKLRKIATKGGTITVKSNSNPKSCSIIQCHCCCSERSQASPR